MHDARGQPLNVYLQETSDETCGSRRKPTGCMSPGESDYMYVSGRQSTGRKSPGVSLVGEGRPE